MTSVLKEWFGDKFPQLHKAGGTLANIMENLLRNEEFNNLFENVKKQIGEYLEENEIKLDENISIDDIIMWQRNLIGEYLVHPSEKCPKNIEQIVLTIIRKNNPTIKD